MGGEIYVKGSVPTMQKNGPARDFSCPGRWFGGGFIYRGTRETHRLGIGSLRPSPLTLEGSRMGSHQDLAPPRQPRPYVRPATPAGRFGGAAPKALESRNATGNLVGGLVPGTLRG
jgi:hypothetical protein